MLRGPDARERLSLAPGAGPLVEPVERETSMSDVYGFEAKTLAGAEAPLAEYRGKVLLIVNTASQCGFTPQYEGLERSGANTRIAGFAVLGFPCNQFGKQEPGDAEQIATFCSLELRRDVSDVRQDRGQRRKAHPLYGS